LRTEAGWIAIAVVAVKGDALYDAGDFLGRGSALWHGGVHVGIHFATDGVGYRPDFRRLLGSVKPRRVESWCLWPNVSFDWAEDVLEPYKKTIDRGFGLT